MYLGFDKSDNSFKVDLNGNNIGGPCQYIWYYVEVADDFDYSNVESYTPPQDWIADLSQSMQACSDGTINYAS